MAQSQFPSRRRPVSESIGVLVYILGVVVLLFAVHSAYVLLRTPRSAGSVTWGSMTISGGALDAMVNLLYLGVILIVGSRVASKGVELVREMRRWPSRIIVKGSEGASADG